jgi:Flp pilus assembly pilin Flp
VVTMFAVVKNASDQTGQTMSEYAVVLCVITLAIVTTISVLSGAMNDAFVRTLEIIEVAT